MLIIFFYEVVIHMGETLSPHFNFLSCGADVQCCV